MARRQNRLNDLTAAEWLYWTDTIYVTNYPVDATHRLRKAHGAMKPPEFMAEIIRFFTKQGQMVLDPFAGVGGTLLGAALCERESLGFEINPRWVDIYHRISREFAICDKVIQPRNQCRGECREISGRLVADDCLRGMAALGDESVDAVITDPPYGCEHETTGFADETNFNMFNYDETRDFGNSKDFDEFLDRMRAFGRQALRVLKPGRYLVIIIGDRYRRGEYVPLGVRTADIMRDVGFQLKGIKMWCNKATQRPLKPYALLTSFVPNITHQNIVILMKPALHQ